MKIDLTKQAYELALKCMACDRPFSTMQSVHEHKCPQSWLNGPTMMFEVFKKPIDLTPETEKFRAEEAAARQWAEELKKSFVKVAPVATKPVPTRPSALGPLEVPDPTPKSVQELRAELRKMIGRR